MINFNRPCPFCGNTKKDDRVYRCPSCGQLLCDNCAPSTTCSKCGGRTTWSDQIGWLDLD